MQKNTGDQTKLEKNLEEPSLIPDYLLTFLLDFLLLREVDDFWSFLGFVNSS
jgi:hypothetical protein